MLLESADATDLLGGFLIMKNFITLSEREIPALAISLEEEDERVYADFVEGFKQDFPASASVFDACAATNRATVEGSSSCIGKSLVSTSR